MQSQYRRAFIAPLAVCASLIFAGASQAAEPYNGASAGSVASDPTPAALSPADRLSYTTAFDALRRGQLDLARESARQARDRVLLGQVEFERLFHPDHVATYEELAEWLETYSDLPCAPRVYNLALRRRPDGAAEPKRPAGMGGRTWNSVVAAGAGSASDDPLKAARIAYNADDLIGATTIGTEIGDWWVVGLAQYRRGDFGASTAAFAKVLDDPTEDPWVRAGAAVWAAKAAARSGQQDRVQPLLHRAAQWPATFYGQIALAQLGEEPTIENQGPRAYEAQPRLQRARLVAEPAIGVDPRALADFVQSDDRARRTVAYLEVGRRADARDELKSGLRGAVSDTARAMWTALAQVMAPRVMGGDDEAARIDATRYAQPEITPDGGFVIERSLVYAIARKETDFNAQARSAAGAYGMMQVMPTTAAELSGDRGFVEDPTRLLQPNVNARLGQAYVQKVLAMPAINGDLLRVAASYNAGPGPMVMAVRKLGQDADPLLLIETIDVPQARDYVEKVVAAYWIYQRMNGRPLNTLQALASGATAVPLSLDYVAPALPAPSAVDLAQAPTTAGTR